MSEAVLCYIEGDCWAFFTTRALEEQTGDDWDDAPYDCNAGSPREPYENEGSWEIVHVAFESDYHGTPAQQGELNCPWSVHRINRGDIAWLIPYKWAEPNVKPIHAGVTLSEFKRLIREAGGKVFEESKT